MKISDQRVADAMVVATAWAERFDMKPREFLEMCNGADIVLGFWGTQEPFVLDDGATLRLGWREPPPRGAGCATFSGGDLLRRMMALNETPPKGMIVQLILENEDEATRLAEFFLGGTVRKKSWTNGDRQDEQHH